MNWGLVLAIYAIGVVVVWLFMLSQVAKEPTSHGQGILLPMGVIAVLAWPLAIPLALFALVTWLFGKKPV